MPEAKIDVDRADLIACVSFTTYVRSLDPTVSSEPTRLGLGF
jgi:hypothetical protein